MWATLPVCNQDRVLSARTVRFLVTAMSASGLDAGESPTAAPPSDSVPALRTRGVTKFFDAQCALDNFCVTVAQGEVHALVGQNGSGKSTLVKLLAGYHAPQEGAYAEVQGHVLSLGSGTAAQNAGLRFVHQNLGLVEGMTVAENFRINESRRSLSRLPKRRERQDAAQALEKLGYGIDPHRRVSELIASERTAVALARALDGVASVPVLVLDEPTASLPGPEVERLFAAVRRVAESGTAVLFISHQLGEVFELADTVTVLRDGKTITTCPVSDLSQDQLVEHMLGRRLVAAAQRAELSDEGPPVESPVAARLTTSRLQGAVVDDLSVRIAPGEVVGVSGLTGSGREELAGLVAGRAPRAGEVKVDDIVVAPGDPRAAIDAGMAFVPADRAQAMLPAASVRENLTLADLRPLFKHMHLSTKAEKQEAAHWAQELDVRPPDPRRLISELSGGNQQKVIIARWMRTHPKVLVLDEPTQGVDVGSKADIHLLIERAAQQGASVLVCSTDDYELARLCTRVLVLRDGRVCKELRGSEVTRERLEEEQLVPGSSHLPH